MSFPNLVDGYNMTFVAHEDMVAYERVTLRSDGKVESAGAASQHVGFVDHRGATAGATCNVRLAGAPFQIGIASTDGITVGGAVYPAGAGKIQHTGTIRLGTALDASTANGDYVQFITIAEDKDTDT